jgi:hypothetical protein
MDDQDDSWANDVDGFNEILLKMKKRTYNQWKSSKILYKVLYFLEIPMRFLV